MKIYFIENSSIKFDANDRYNNILRGGETVLINIAEQLVNLNHEIHVFNMSDHKMKNINGVFWSNINFLKQKEIDISCDICIVQADANLFKYVNCKRRFLISHSIQKFEKFLRKKQLLPFIKYKPKVITAGEYHFKNRSYITSFGGKLKMFWSVDDMFFNTELDDSVVENKAIFTTRPDRNLSLLLDIWNNKIHPQSIKSYIHINPPYKTTENDKNVIIRTLGDQKLLLNDLKTSRIMLVPGHKSEVFCLAAQEACEMCVPIITFGYGSLFERVEHNVTGFIAKNKDDFANYSLKLLKDLDLWRKFRNNLYKKRGKQTWKKAAQILNEFFV